MPKYCKCQMPIMDEITRRCMICHKIVKSSVLKVRKWWQRKPQTQIKKSDKIYNRKKAKRKLRKRIKKEAKK